MPLSLSEVKSEELTVVESRDVSTMVVTQIHIDLDKKEVIVNYKKGYGDPVVWGETVYMLCVSDGEVGSAFTDFIAANPVLYSTIKDGAYDLVKEQEGVEGTIV